MTEHKQENEGGPTQLRELLENTLLSSLLPDRKIISIHAKESVATALERLTEANILSMPVWDDEKHHYKGMVDMEDLVALCMDTLNHEPDLQRAGHKFEHMPVSKALNFSTSDVYMPTEKDVSLYYLIEVLTRGIHRVPVVVETGGPVINIISQSSVVQFLAGHLDVLSHCGEQTWTNLKLSHEKPYTIDKHAKASEGFAIITQHQIEAIAIVDKHSKFCGSLSISDLRGLSYHLFERLNLPVLRFVKAQAHQNLDRLLTASADLTLTEAIKTLSEHNAHRIWILDEEQKPIGMFSLTDVMKAILLATNAKRHIWQHHKHSS